MDGILIYRNLSVLEINFVVTRFSNGAKIFISSYLTKQKELENIETNSIQLDDKEKKEIFRQLKEEILAFGDKKKSDKTRKEILGIDNISIWYYHKFRIFYQIRDLYYTIYEINQYSTEFDNLFVYIYDSLDQRIIKNLPENVTLFKKKQTKSKLNIKSLINYFIVVSFRSFISLFQNFQIKTNKKHIIISNPNARNVYLNRVNLNEDVDDVFLGYLMQDTDDSFLFIDDLPPPPFKAHEVFRLKKRYFFNRKKRHQLNSEFILLRGALSLKVHKQLKHSMISINKAYFTIEQEALNNTEHIILQYIKNLHSSTKYYLFRYFAFKFFFEKYPFKTITAQDENASLTKTILDAAKTHSIITIGIQHGAMGDSNMYYMFTKDDLRLRPMPDYTLVWGDNPKEIVIKSGNYPESSIIKVGQIRTDIIPFLKNLKKSDLIQGISNELSIIVFATQPIPDLVLRKKSTEDVFKAIKDLDNCTLLLKLHPRENNQDYYHEIADYIGCKNYIIKQNTDLYSIISICDILITCYSTVGGEAVYFDKPLIILDYLRLDHCGYHQAKVAFQVTNADELKNTVINILNKNLTINPFAYDEYKEKFAYKIDGNVSKRCLEFIKSFE